MDAREEIQQAIETLTDLRAETDYSEINGWLVEYEHGEPSPLTSDPLIVTLHRTIDAQLDLLLTARGFYGAGITGPETATVFAELALAVARAINGGA